MSSQGNVAELIDGETHHAYMWNEKNMHYYTNSSGGSVASGDVVVLNTSGTERFKTTTTAGDARVLGVVPQKDDVNGTAADQTIANGAAGMVQFAGDIGKVNVDAATAIGQFLIASATAKKASPTSTYQVGVFGIAASASAGAGTVSARLFAAQGGVPLVATANIADDAVTSPKLSLTSNSAALAADVALTNGNQYYTILSLSLPAGIWKVEASVLGKVNSGNENVTVKIWDGAATVYSSTSHFYASGNQAAPVTPPNPPPIVLATTTTICVSAACQNGNGTIMAAAPSNGAGNNASMLAALRIG